MTQRQRVTVDVHVILEQAGHILLCLREGTGYADGLYCLPSGHLDEGETIVDCAIREAREEVGSHHRPETPATRHRPASPLTRRPPTGGILLRYAHLDG
ncbi:NUDIX domain-containing protein [Acrocarpospora sp. B8E8]|uniref:NUDIX domain-containing protein n=1 Tax=Acrocarpospora sp. B8E8 TaxID=3153572 RepID=UPI00325F19CE